MKTSSIFLVCLLLYVSCEEYTSKFDNVDLDEILKNDRLLTNYHKCLMTGDGCTADGELLKKTIPDALETECAKCTEKQKNMSKKVSRHLMTEKPDLWQQLMDKYDPDKKYRAAYEAYLKTL